MARPIWETLRISALVALCVVLVASPDWTLHAQSPNQLPVAGPAGDPGSGTDLAGINGFDTSMESPVAAPIPPTVRSRSLTQLLIAGGPLMIPIVFCSFVLVVFALERSISLRRNRIIPGSFARKFLEQLRAGDLTREQAVAVCEKNASPVSRVFLAGVQKWGRSGIEVEQAVLDAGERVSNDLRRYLRMINGIATLCPLLGLLGTVFGMIESFDAISTATGTAAEQKSLTASGISVALITTAAGMSIAIPALILYLSLTSLVERRVTEIDSLGMKLVSLVSAEATAESGRAAKPRKAA